jgi:hypothetical protein
MTLEKRIQSELAELADKTFSIIAHELWGNSREGYHTNTSWYLARGADFADLLRIARGRWEVFKVNYSPRATIHGLSFEGDERTVYAESEGIPFLEIRVND